MTSTFDSRKNANKGFDIYGKERLALGLVVKKILNNLQDVWDFDWILDSGTLLGAYRNGKFIIHDDDFDIALIVKSKLIISSLEFISHDIQRLLPKPYACRVVNTYTDKIEVYDPTMGKYILANKVYNGADFHNVTVDLQIVYFETGDELISTYRAKPFVMKYNYDTIYPIKEIKLMNNMFNCPNNTIKYLESDYGYIGDNAIFDEKTGKYIKKN